VIDLESFLASHGGTRSAGSSGLQYVLNCPWCGSRDLYVAVEPAPRGHRQREARPGDFICFKGRCGERGGLPKLYAQLEGVDRKDARIALALAANGGRMAGRRVLPPPVRQEPAPPPPKKATPKAAQKRGEARVEIPDYLPPEFIPCWDGARWRVPKYLSKRGLERETLREFGVGYCGTGRYGGRVVLPIACPAGASFTARAISPDDDLRYLSGPGAGQLLFGWGQAARAWRSDRDLVIVEGPFDAMACWQAGHPAVAVLGKRFRETQIQMLRGFEVRRFVLMLDGDALDDALQQAEMLGREVSVAAPLEGKDPAEAVERGEPEAIGEAIAAAAPLRGARAGRVAELVGYRRARGGW
jgi:hypothetical protein